MGRKKGKKAKEVKAEGIAAGRVVEPGVDVLIVDQDANALVDPHVAEGSSCDDDRVELLPLNRSGRRVGVDADEGPEGVAPAFVEPGGAVNDPVADGARCVGSKMEADRRGGGPGAPVHE